MVAANRQIGPNLVTVVGIVVALVMAVAIVFVPVAAIVFEFALVVEAVVFGFAQIFDLFANYFEIYLMFELENPAALERL